MGYHPEKSRNSNQEPASRHVNIDLGLRLLMYITCTFLLHSRTYWFELPCSLGNNGRPVGNVFSILFSECSRWRHHTWSFDSISWVDPKKSLFLKHMSCQMNWPLMRLEKRGTLSVVSMPFQVDVAWTWLVMPATCVWCIGRLLGLQ